MKATTITPLVAAQVRTALDEAGISRAAISRNIGTPRTTLTRKLAGHQPFTFDEILSIMEETGKPIGYFCPIPELRDTA
jgi:hypothetical protein